jgi:hypothetical protein
VPVASQGEDEDEHRDHKHAGGFQCVNVRLGMPLGCRRFGLPLWTGGGHGYIVALNLKRRASSFRNAVPCAELPPRGAKLRVVYVHAACQSCWASCPLRSV